MQNGEPVEVFNDFSRSWIGGFEVDGWSAAGVQLRRISDGCPLPSLVSGDHVRGARRAVVAGPAVDDGVLAGTVAHALLASMRIITDASSGLVTDDLRTPASRAALSDILRHADHVTGVLFDLVRGLPVMAREVLDGTAAIAPGTRPSGRSEP